MMKSKLSTQCQSFIADFVYKLSPGWDDLPPDGLYAYVLRKNNHVLKKLIAEIKQNETQAVVIENPNIVKFSSELFESYINDEDRLKSLETEIKDIIKNNSQKWWVLCSLGLKYSNWTSLESFIGLEVHWDKDMTEKEVTPKQIVKSLNTIPSDELENALQQFYKISVKEFSNLNTRMSKFYEDLLTRILPIYDQCPESQPVANELSLSNSLLTQYSEQQSDWKEKTRIFFIIHKMTMLSQARHADVVNSSNQFIHQHIGNIMLHMEIGELSKFIKTHSDVVSRFPDHFSSVARKDEKVLRVLLDNVPNAFQPVFQNLITDENLATWLINWLQSCEGKIYKDLEKAVIDVAYNSSDHENAYKAFAILQSKKTENEDTTQLDQHFSSLLQRLNFTDPNGFENVLRLMDIADYHPQGDLLSQLKEYYRQFGYDKVLPNVQRIRDLGQKVLKVKRKPKKNKNSKDSE